MAALTLDYLANLSLVNVSAWLPYNAGGNQIVAVSIRNANNARCFDALAVHQVRFDLGRENRTVLIFQDVTLSLDHIQESVLVKMRNVAGQQKALAVDQLLVGRRVLMIAQKRCGSFYAQLAVHANAAPSAGVVNDFRVHPVVQMADAIGAARIDNEGRSAAARLSHPIAIQKKRVRHSPFELSEQVARRLAAARRVPFHGRQIGAGEQVAFDELDGLDRRIQDRVDFVFFDQMELQRRRWWLRGRHKRAAGHYAIQQGGDAGYIVQR